MYWYGLLLLVSSLKVGYNFMEFRAQPRYLRVIPIHTDSLQKKIVLLVVQQRWWQLSGNLRYKKRVLKQLGYSPSLIALPCKASLHKINKQRIGDWLVGYLMVFIGDGFELGPESLVLGEGSLHVDHLVEYATKGPDV